MASPSMLTAANSTYDVCHASLLTDPSVSLLVFECDTKHDTFHLSLGYSKFVSCYLIQGPSFTSVCHDWQYIFIEDPSFDFY